MNHHLPARSDNQIRLVLTSRSYPPEPILNPSGLSPFIRLFAQVPFFMFQTIAMRKQSAGGRKTKTGCATCRLVWISWVVDCADLLEFARSNAMKISHFVRSASRRVELAMDMNQSSGLSLIQLPKATPSQGSLQSLQPRLL